jgi:hypothetical protein
MAKPPTVTKELQTPSAPPSPRPRRCATSTSPWSTCSWPSEGRRGPPRPCAPAAPTCKRLEKQAAELPRRDSRSACPRAPPSTCSRPSASTGCSSARPSTCCRRSRSPSTWRACWWRCFASQESHAVLPPARGGRQRVDLVNYVSHGVGQARRRGRVARSAPGKSPRTRRGGEAGRGGRRGRARPARAVLQPTSTSSPRRARSTRSSAAPWSSSAPSACSAAAGRTTPLFVGEPGVGKTAIAEGLAQAIHEGNVPDVLKGCRGVQPRHGRAARGHQVSAGSSRSASRPCSRPSKKHPRRILFIDEIHTIVGAGATSGGSMDASNLLKPALAAGRLRCIGSTTYSEYRSPSSATAPGAALPEDRRRRALRGGDDQILEGLKPGYEEHHEVTYTPRP